MTRTAALVVMVSSIMIATAGRGYAQFPAWAPPGPNLAAGKSYSLSPGPNYGLCSDPDDKIQLTDGQFASAEKPMHWFRETVGWFMGTASITMDLGATQAIGGVGFSTEQQPVPGIGWPREILILVSDDGQTFHLAGELISLAAKFGPAPEVGRHWFRTDDLKTRGRYVQLVARSSLFVFVDEIEIYAGQPKPLKAPVAGPVVTNAVAYLGEHATAYGVLARTAQDVAQARAVAAALPGSGGVKAKTDRALTAIHKKILAEPPGAYPPEFRAVAPLNALHAEAFAALSPAYRAAGYPEYGVWTTNRWARQTPFDHAAAGAGAATLDLHAMQNDRRAEALNVANYSPSARTAVVHVEGLPGGPRPPYLAVRQVEYIAMPSRQWDASPVLPAETVADGWAVTLPAGLSRQLWLEVNTGAGPCPAGRHEGVLVIQIEDGETLRVPLTLTVAGFTLPAYRDRAVAAGFWDYTAKGGSAGYAINTGNLHVAVAHMRASGVTAPWAMNDWGLPNIFPVGGAKFDEHGNVIGPIDYSAFDQWVDMWPDAKHYMIYVGAWWGAVGAKWGTSDPETQRLLGQRMKEWVRHMRERNLDPARVCLLLCDEPHSGELVKLTLAWAEAIKAATPEIQLYTDPFPDLVLSSEPAAAKMLSLMDIIAPGCWPTWGYPGDEKAKALDAAYGAWAEKGKALGHYACAQNISEGDAIGYYRLQPWACWKLNRGGPASHVGYWSVGDTRGNRPWNPLLGGGDRNWSPLYIDAHSVTDSKHWLAVFEGVNDYEYLLMLKTRVEALEKAGRKDDNVIAARKLVDTLGDETIAAVRAGDIGACDAARRRVLEALAALEE